MQTQRTDHPSSLIFNCKVDGKILSGSIKGSGGLIGDATTHLPIEKRVIDARGRIAALRDNYERTGRIAVYEPKKGHVCLCPNGWDGPSVAIPIGSEISISVDAQR